MTEEEQEKLYELLFKDTKNKLEKTIEEQQNKIASLKKQIKLMQSCDLAKVIEKQQKEIEELENKIAKRQWVKVKENGEVELLFYISKDKIREKIKEIERKGFKNEINFSEYFYKTEVLLELLKE